ncbi:MAG: hypothetical protein DWI06_02860 [Planctomycetota bacterium]|nr:MAG: hypothetical protein DWI06_02860 [Planctomycetota bacterium]
MHIHDFSSGADKFFTLQRSKHQVYFPDRVVKSFPSFYFRRSNFILGDSIGGHQSNGLNSSKDIADKLSLDPERFLSKPYFFSSGSRTALPSYWSHQGIKTAIEFDRKPCIN